MVNRDTSYGRRDRIVLDVHAMPYAMPSRILVVASLEINVATVMMDRATIAITIAPVVPVLVVVVLVMVASMVIVTGSLDRTRVFALNSKEANSALVEVVRSSIL